MKIVTKEQIAREKVKKWILTESIMNDVKQVDIANALTTTQSNISKKTECGSFKAFEIILLQQKLGFDISKLG